MIAVLTVVLAIQQVTAFRMSSRTKSQTLKMSSVDSDSIAKARNSIDDIAVIKEGRTVPLSKYRNIGIMAHITLEKPIKLVKCMKGQQQWIGWNKNKSEALQLRPLRLLVHGKIAESILLTREYILFLIHFVLHNKH